MLEQISAPRRFGKPLVSPGRAKPTKTLRSRRFWEIEFVISKPFSGHRTSWPVAKVERARSFLQAQRINPSEVLGVVTSHTVGRWLKALGAD